VHPSDCPSGKQGDVLTVEFTIAGVSCLGHNGGPMFKHNEAFSFQIATDDQEETDGYWNAIVGNGGQDSACGWCKDKWGVSCIKTARRGLRPSPELPGLLRYQSDCTAIRPVNTSLRWWLGRAYT
jgi:hypothetical protein